jgi:uncharacterized protein
VWVTQIDQQRRRVTLTAVRPGTQRSGSRGRRPQRLSPKSSSPRPPRRGERREYPRKPKRFDVGKRVKKAPRPVTPITQDMVEGKAPMRSFSDLAQFFSKKKDDQKDE